MLYLNQEEVAAAAASCGDLLQAIEQAYRIYAEKDFYMPPRFSVDYKGDNLLYMPCFAGDVFGTKVLSLFPENKLKGKDFISGVMLLNDAETGELRAILNAKALTAYRTAAVTSCALKYLMRQDETRLGIAGAGVQGFHQALFAVQAFEHIDRVMIYDPFVQNLDAFMEHLRGRAGRPVSVSVAASSEQLLKCSDVIITATNAQQPVLPGDPALLQGKLICAVGSYKHEMRECPDALFPLLDTIYVDLEHACEESGDLYFPLKDGLATMDKVVPFCDVITGKHQPDRHTTRLFKTVGMGLFDLCVAEYLYSAAVRLGLGVPLED